MKIEKAIDDVCQTMIKEVENHFKMLEEHECLNRIDGREQFIMKMMPIVFKKKLLKKLKEVKTNEKQ